MQIKKLLFIAIPALAALALFSTSCKKSSNLNSSGVSATVGGSNFNPAITTAFYYQGNSSFNVGGYSVNGKDTTLLALTVAAPFTVNTQLTNAAQQVVINWYTGGKDYYAAYGTGTAALTVTAFDSVAHKISGNFSGTLYAASNDSVIVTNGRFNTGYSVQ